MSDPHEEHWREYRRVYWRSMGLTVAFFFGGGILSSVLSAAFRAPWVFPLAFVPFVLATIWVSQEPMRWPCPQCGEPFFSTWWYHNAFTKKCLHCGLPKG